MRKFNVGDVVVFQNEVGIIRGITSFGAYAVEFPNWDEDEGHTCHGRVPSGKGWFCGEDKLMRADTKVYMPFSPPNEVEKAIVHVETPEAEDNVAAIQDAEAPKGRLMRAFEKFEAAKRQQDEACEEIEQILNEMRNNK
ncbi:MAG: hypothetical protein DBY32_11360 [Phascolarctobacterium sp.]|nr:MAG: hypothetical protein DBY32_11360 [Phascolarctobacterium sp.]